MLCSVKFEFRLFLISFLNFLLQESLAEVIFDAGAVHAEWFAGGRFSGRVYCEGHAFLSRGKDEEREMIDGLGIVRQSCLCNFNCFVSDDNMMIARIGVSVFVFYEGDSEEVSMNLTKKNDIFMA